MKVFEPQEEEISVTTLSDGTVDVISDETLLFVPCDDNHNYEKDDSPTHVNNMVVLYPRNDINIGRGMGLVRNSAVLRNTIAWTLKKILVYTGKKNDIKVTHTDKAYVQNISGIEALTMGFRLRDKNGNDADAKVYLLSGGEHGLLMMVINKKGKVGFTQKDTEQLLSTITLR